MDHKSLLLSIVLASTMPICTTQSTIYLPFVAGAAGAVGYGIRDAQVMGNEAIKKELRQSKFNNPVDEQSAAKLLSSKSVKAPQPISMFDSILQELICLKKGIPLTLKKAAANIQAVAKSVQHALGIQS